MYSRLYNDKYTEIILDAYVRLPNVFRQTIFTTKLTVTHISASYHDEKLQTKVSIRLESQCFKIDL